MFLQRVCMAKLQAEYGSEADVPQEFKGAFTEKDGKYVFTGGEVEFYNEADKQGFETAKGHIKTELATAKEAQKLAETKAMEAVSKNEVLELQIKDGADPAKLQELVETKVKVATEMLTKENDELKGINSDFQNKIHSGDKKGFINDVRSSFSDSIQNEAGAILDNLFERQEDNTYLTKEYFGLQAGLNKEQAIAELTKQNAHWGKQNTPSHGGGSEGSNVNTDDRSKFDTLLKKQQGGEVLNRQESVELSTLANNLKNEE